MNHTQQIKRSAPGKDSSGFNQFLSHFAAFSLFVLLPVIAASLLGINAINLEEQNSFNQTRSALETSLNQFVCDIDQNTFLRKVARGAWHELSKAPTNPKRTANFIKKLQNFLPVEFDLYLFDQKGKLATPRNVRLRSRYVATKLWQLIKSPALKQSNLFKKIRKPIKSFLGGEFTVAQLLSSKDALLPIIVKHTTGRIYWQDSKSDQLAGMMLIFWEMPDAYFRIKETVKRREEQFQQAFATLPDNETLNFGQKEIAQDTVTKINTRLTYLNQPFFMLNKKLWMAKKAQNCWIFISRHFSKSHYNFLSKMLLAGLFILTLTGLIITITLSSTESLRFSIRFKLLILFFTAVIIPVMGFCFLGYQYLTDREATLVSEVANTSRTNLFSLDDSFRKLGESYEKDWHKLLPILASDDHKKIRRRLSGKLASNELVTVEVRDDNAVMQFTEVNELFFEGMREVSEAFSRFCIDTALGSSLKDGVDPVLSMIITAPEGGMYFLFDRPGEIHPLRFGPVPLLIMWKIIENIRNEKLYVFIVQSANVLLKRLVEKRLSDKHSSSKDSAYITLARHNQSDEWFPARPAGGKELKKFAARLIFSNKPQDHEVTIKGKTWLVTGQNGKYADGYSFYSFYPKRIVTQNLANIKKLLAAGILLFFLVALLTANILSHTFLVPVSRLSEGVEAIKNRNGEFRIETDQNDEFGDLAMSFNHMIEDLKEMQLAKDVQESLLPTNFLAIPGYELTFTNRMASDVGGDYFDLQRLDDNRVFLLIGDVTGHGVSSALVMAMAKAIVYQGLKEGRTLIELFADLNIAVHTYFKIPPARKMITLFAAILDQQTSTLSCANAGHNFPLKIMPNGKCEDLNAVHLPIGAGKKLRNLQICDYQLNQEDFVVFYTDGIIEVKNDLDEMYGYERFRKHLSSLAGCSAQDILQELEKSYDSYLLEAEPEDDITVIVLKKI